MAGLIKELYLDYANNRLSIEQKSDLSYAIQLAYKSKLFTYEHICILDRYLQGYTVEEVSIKCNKSQDYIEKTLLNLFTVLEILSDYTDSHFVHTLRHVYSEKRLKKLEQFVYEHGRIF